MIPQLHHVAARYVRRRNHLVKMEAGAMHRGDASTARRYRRIIEEIELDIQDTRRAEMDLAGITGEAV